MKNPREYPFWDNEFFGAARQTWEDGEYGLYILFSGLTAIAGGFVGVILIGFPLDYFFLEESAAILYGCFSGMVLGQTLIRMSKFYKGYGMPRSGWRDPYPYNISRRVEEYFSLPKEDRKLYPEGIVETLRNPDLTKDQLRELDRKMESVYSNIVERNKQRRRLAARDIDTDSLLQHMNDSMESLKVESKTYREFAD